MECAVMCSRESVLCTLQEVYSVYTSELRLTGRENASNLKTKSGWQSEVADLIVNVFLKYPTQVSLSWFCTSGTASSITSGLTTYHPVNCVVAILSKSKTTRVSSTRMQKTTEKRMMSLGVRVLLRSTVPNFRLAIPDTLAFQDRVYHSVALCLLLEYVQYPFLVPIVITPQLLLISLGILVILSTACLADFPLYHVDVPDCSFFLVDQQAFRERYQSVRCVRDIVQTHRSNQWLLGIFCDPNRFSIDPKHS